MSLFGKKKKEGMKTWEESPDFSGIPKLPSLPRIEDYSNQSTYSQDLTHLPSIPSNSFGEKFSQSAVKEAFSVKKEGDEGLYADELPEIPSMEDQMMREPSVIPRLPYPRIESRAPLTREVESFNSTIKSPAVKGKKSEPVFIRIDKFEESLNVFEEAKQKISEIERMLEDIKELKETEEKELSNWEREMQHIKTQIERVDRDIFSKIE